MSVPFVATLAEWSKGVPAATPVIARAAPDEPSVSQVMASALVPGPECSAGIDPVGDPQRTFPQPVVRPRLEDGCEIRSI